MPEEIITRDSAAFKELYRDIVKAIRAVDILIDTHRPTIGNELYLTSEEICSIFSISKRSLQNYRDNRQIPYTTLGGKILYPQSSLYKLLEQFQKAGIIAETRVEGRKRCYQITQTGLDMLEKEYQRLMLLTADYHRYKGGL